MMIAGGLAGLAGTIETLGLNHKFAPEFTGGVGFDGITVALLGQTNPIGVVLSAFLLGALTRAAPGCSSIPAFPADIIQVIQALVLAFVAAPTIIRQTLSHPQAERSDRIHSIQQRVGEVAHNGQPTNARHILRYRRAGVGLSGDGAAGQHHRAWVKSPGCAFSLASAP
jgi:hypothetical protein